MENVSCKSRLTRGSCYAYVRKKLGLLLCEKKEDCSSHVDSLREEPLTASFWNYYAAREKEFFNLRERKETTTERR